MSQETIDLWPEQLEPAGMETPVGILRKQAALLGEKTGNLVTANVRSPGLTQRVVQRGAWYDAQRFVYFLDLVAPALSDYRFRLLTIAHDIELYPVAIRPHGREGEELVAHSEEEFVELLGRVLSSDETRRIIQRLIAQSEAES